MLFYQLWKVINQIIMEQHKEEKNLLDRLTDDMKTQKFKDFMDNYFDKLNRRARVHESQLERFNINYDHRFEEIVDKLITKYDSDSYVKREHKIGCEPREELFWFLNKYVQKYGEELSDEELDTLTCDFTSTIMKYKGYVFHVIVGQGSAILVDKLSDLLKSKLQLITKIPFRFYI